MANLYFKVGADWEEVVRLRSEIDKLKQALKGIDSSRSPAAFNSLNAQLSASTQRMDELVTSAARAGSEIEGGFKRKIFDASQVVSGLTEKIIAQKSVVKDVEADVKRLGEAYRMALKRNPSSADSTLEEYKAARRALDEEKAALFGLTQEQANARLSVKRLRDEYALYNNKAKEVAESNNSMAISWKKALAVVGGTGILKALGSDMIRVRGEFQAADTAIQTLLGNKEKSDVLMSQVRELAMISSLGFSDFTQATQMMLGFNIEAEKVPRFLAAIGDVSMGNKQKFNSLTLAFSQMSAAGKLMGQDLNQMINAGFNPLQIMADKTGKSIATLKDEMSKGAISAEMVQQAFIDATAAGGKFYNMSENASKTINGQLSMMQDAIDAAYNEIGEKAEGAVLNGIKAITSLIQNYETVGKVLTGLVAVYGTYRTAVMLSSVATGKHTLAEIALTNVRIAARKAQLALNAAMLTNPYVFVATAIAGAAAAAWALSDSTSAANKAQKEFNREKDEAIKKEQKHSEAIQGLIDKVRDETQSIIDREAALLSLKNEYPEIFAQYDIEKLKLADILEIRRKINEADSKAKRQKSWSAVVKQQTFVEEQSPYMDEERLKKEQEKLKLLARDFQKEFYLPDFLGKVGGMSDEQLRQNLGNIANMTKNGTFMLSKGIPVDKDVSDEMLKALREEIKKRETPQTTYAEDYKMAEKEWEEAKKELEKIEKDKDKFTKEQYEAAKKRKETAEKAYKNLGGDTTGKAEKKAVRDSSQEESQRKSQERISELLDRQSRDRIKAEVDMANMEEQARIDAMQDGFEKTMAQMKLDNKKELEELERQKQEYIRKVVEQEKAIFDAREDAKAKKAKSEGKAYKKQTFDTEAAAERVKATDSVVAKYDVVMESTMARQTEDEAKAVKKTLDGMLSEYLTYEQSRTKVAEEYQKKRDALYERDENGNFVTDEGGNRKLRAGVEQGNIDEIDRAEKEDLAAIDEQFASREATFEAWMNEIGDWSLEKLKSVLAEAKAELEKLEKKNPNDPKLATARAKANVLEKKVEKKSAEAEVSPKKRSIKEWNALRDALQDCVDAFDEVGDAVGGVAGEVISTAGGVMSSTLGMINGIVQLVNMSTQSMTGTATSAAAAIGMVEKASVILTIISLALQAIMAIVNLAKSITNKKHEDRIEALNKKNEELDKSIDKLEKSYDSLGKQADKAYSVDASKLIEQQNVLLEQEKQMLAAKKANIKLMIAEEEAKKGSDKDQIAEWRKQIEEIDETLEETNEKIKENKEAMIEALAGQDMKEAIESFSDAYADAWTNGEDAAESSMKTTRSMIRNALSNYLNTIIGPYAQKFNATLAKAMEDGIISPYEEAKLDAIVDDMDAKAQQYYERTKKYWEDKEAENQQQSASSKGYQALSEDTGNELVGLNLAHYESNLRLEDAVSLQTGVQSGIKDIASDIRSIIADSYLELAAIRENTDSIVIPIKNLSDKMNRWDKIIMSL